MEMQMGLKAVLPLATGTICIGMQEEVPTYVPKP